jgi:hypothetical protein
MKQIKNISVALLILFTGISFIAGGCKKSNGSNNLNPNPSNQGTLSASIGGTAWQANAVYAVDSSNLIAIVGSASTTSANNFPILLMVFPDNTPEGSTINFDIIQSSMLQYYENQNTAYYAEPSIGGSGSVKITKFNKSTKRIEGNFTATLKSATPGGASKTLTGGQFAINYR